MRFWKPVPVVLLLALTICVTARHFVYQCIISFQKDNFRTAAIRDAREIKLLYIKKTALYENSIGFEWKENGKELVIGGVYHEVLKVANHRGRIVLYLIEDKTESKLFTAFFETREKAGDLQFIKQLLSMVFILPFFFVGLNQHLFSLFYTNLRFRIPDGFRQKTDLPPQR